MEKHRKMPPLPGQRILRSVVAVWLCFAVYLLRGRQGIPIYSTIAVLQCIQPYTRTMNSVAKKRLVGTLIGALWGLAALLLELELLSERTPDELLHYLLVGIFAGAVIYSTVLLNLRESSYFSAVVFLTITVNHIWDVNPYLFVFNRSLDTVIGVLIAEIVNRVQLPRARNRDTLFVSGIDETILGDGGKLSPYAKVELNRLIEDGAKFTVSTVETQATVRELMAGVDLRYPIITMDGAALYDMNRMEYLRTVPMTAQRAERIIRWARAEGQSFFSNIIQDNLLVIRYADLTNEAMQDLFDKKRKSPYRNFVKSPKDFYEDVVYLLVLERTERIEQSCQTLMEQPWAGEYRVVKDEYPGKEGYSFLKIYDAAASRESMLPYLEERMGTKRTVTFGSIPGKYDVHIADAAKNTVVKELRRRYEPVDIRCWKTVFRI